jgi:hypothetical protein
VSPPPAATQEKPSAVLASLAALGSNVILYGAFLFHALRVRDRLERLAEKLVPGQVPPAAEAYLALPTPVLAAAVLLLLVGLLIKEVAFDRRATALKLNVAAFAAGLLCFAGFLVFVQRALEGARLR